MNIAIISASTRLGRQTHKAALGLHKYLQQFENVQPVLADLLQYKIPLFEETLMRHPDPSDALRDLGAILARADAMLFVTPEYNGSYSPALKNAVDHYNKTEFARKAVGIVTVTTGSMGGVRAGLALQHLILALFAYPTPQMLLVPSVQTKFDEAGNLLDPAFEKNIANFMKEFLWLAEAVHEKKKSELVRVGG
jgi:NAD(P)H-dependent FMN reductase